MPAQLSKELVATVLVEALYTTDDLACRRHGISLKSLQRYRQALPDDSELADIVRTKKLAWDAAWAEDLPAVLLKGLRTLDNCFGAIQGDAEAMKKPDVIHALAGALRIGAEIYFTGKVLDARFISSDSEYMN